MKKRFSPFRNHASAALKSPSSHHLHKSAWPVVALLAAGAAMPSVASDQPPILPKTVVAADAVHTEVVAKGLDHPWALAFLPDGRFLVTERPGRLRIVSQQGQLQAPISGLPRIAVGGQGGLLDVVLDSDFANNRTLFFCYSEPSADGNSRLNSTAMARAQLSADNTQLQDVKVIFSQKPKIASQLHFGCRIVERKVQGKSDGTLFLTLGERSTERNQAQLLSSDLGKIVRVGKNGSVPQDNPFVGRQDVLPEIWSYGHRSPQGAALAPDGQLWMNEHGPQGGDEINRPEPGKNYGWPVITYGEEYGGGKIGEGITAKAGMEQPLYYWVPSIAVSGMAFINTDQYGASWKGSMLVGGLKSKDLVRLTIQDQKVTSVEQLLPKLNRRVRDVREAPNGTVYLLTDENNGELLRVVPGKGS